MISGFSEDERSKPTLCAGQRRRRLDPKQVVRRYVKAYDTGDQGRVSSFLHPRHVFCQQGGGKPMGREERIRDERSFFSAFSDISTKVLDIIGQGDRVACRVEMRCTHTGEYQGVRATNRRVTINYMEILQVSEGKILKEWVEFDPKSISDQLSGRRP